MTSKDNPKNALRQALALTFGTILPTERMEPTAFISLIDAQLYQAKDNGRNRIAAVDHAGIRGEAFKSHTCHACGRG